MKTLIAANWKMYKTWKEAQVYTQELIGLTQNKLQEREVLIFPSFPGLKAVGDLLADKKEYSLGGQNFYPAPEGAFTGEVSILQLKDLGCSYVLVGHSERRHVLGESEKLIAQKVAFGLEQKIKVILCIGEKLEQKEAGKLKEVLFSQLNSALQEISLSSADDLVIAYEPVWAIGTGKVATKQDILEAHSLVRSFLTERFAKLGEEIRILYGGSVKPNNAKSILSLDNVNGVLVGSASLDAQVFTQIILA